MNFLLLALFVLLAVTATFGANTTDAKKCSKDISVASQAVSDGIVLMQKAQDSCNLGEYTYECVDAVTAVMDNVVVCSDAITDAVSECSYTENQCAEDIGECISASAGTASAVMYAILDCQDKDTWGKCRKDVTKAGMEIAKLSIAIGKANVHCQ